LKSRAGQLHAGRKDHFLEFAALLYQISEQDENLRRTIEQVGLSHRAAMYMIQIHRDLVLPGRFLPERLKKIGWTKLAIICPRLGQGKDRYWISLAEKETSQSLRGLVRGKEIRSKAVVFLLSRRDAVRLEKALVQFGAKRRGRALDNRSEALLTMVRHSTNERLV
jgi:hypothetical protein